MKKIILIALAIILINWIAYSVSLLKSLLQAYNDNPELNSKLDNIQVYREDVKMATSEF